MKILVTDGDYKHTLGIVRSLGSKGLRVSVLARERGELAARSRFCSGVELAPDLSVQNCAATVLEILRRGRYDLIIPVGYATTLALSKEKTRIVALARMETAEFSQIDFAADKKRVREMALKLGLHAPDTIYPQSIAEARELADKLRYPLIVKPVVESLVKSVRRVASREEFIAALDSWPLKRSANPPDVPTPDVYTVGVPAPDVQALGVPAVDVPMVQQFIPGYGCGFFALYQHGVCKRVFMHRRVRENPPDGGGSCCAESFYDPHLKAAGLRLLNAMNWHGVAMVEFRYDTSQNKYMLLEVNPKFWGSLDLALCAGVDFPHYLCRMANAESLAYSEEYRRPLRYHWPLSGEIQHLANRPSSLAAISMDTLNPRVRSNVWLSDLGPNLQEFTGLFSSLWRRTLRG